ncbi:MAG: hypothetical protein WCQ16_08125 [Verrucomicrobiae bacterium]
MKKLILAIAVTLVTLGGNITSHGQTPQPKEPKIIIDDFFKAFSEGKFEEAIAAFIKTNPWMEKKPDMLATLKAKYASMPSIAGNYINFKVIKTEDSENISRVKVVAYFDRQPILITFIFYKSGGVWRGQNIDVNFDDAFDEILKNEKK